MGRQGLAGAKAIGLGQAKADAKEAGPSEEWCRLADLAGPDAYRVENVEHQPRQGGEHGAINGAIGAGDRFAAHPLARGYQASGTQWTPPLTRRSLNMGLRYQGRDRLGLDLARRRLAGGGG